MACLDAEPSETIPWEYKSRQRDHPLVKEIFDKHHDYPTLPVTFTVGLVSMDTSETASDINTENIEIEIASDNVTLSGNVVRLNNVRYVVPFVIDNAPFILISIHSGERDPPSCLFYTVKPDDQFQTVTILNLMRKAIYDKILTECRCDTDVAVRAVDFNCPSFSDYVDCSVTSLPEQNTFYVRVDKECLSFFSDQFQSKPELQLFFWKEKGDFVVDRVLMVNDIKEIKLECDKTTVLVKNQAKIDEFKQVIANNSSKTKEIFQDFKTLVGSLENSSVKGGSIPSTRRGFGKPAAENEENWENKLLTYREPIFGNEEFSGQIGRLMSAEWSLGRNETVSFNWIVVCDEIKEIIASGLVPPSEFQSAGLDPEDPEHFKRCLEDVEEKMMKEQRYDIALSHIQGMREIFAAPNLTNTETCVKDFFSKSDLDILKMVYFKSWS